MPVGTGHFSAEVKPLGGKLLRCTVSVDIGIITDIKFTGDFFMIPPKAIHELEQQIVGCPIETETIRRAIETFFAEDVELAGVIPADFVHIIVKIIEKL